MCLINWKLHFLRSFVLKFSLQNVENRILGLWNFKIFWGRTHTDPLPPKKRGLVVDTVGYSIQTCWQLQLLLKPLQYGISAVVAPTSFGGKTVAKCGLLSHPINQCDEFRVARFRLNQSYSSIFRNCSLGKRNTKDFRWWQVIITADKSSRHYFTNNSFTWRLVSAFLLTEVKLATRGTKTRLSDRFCSYQPMQREPEFGF